MHVAKFAVLEIASCNQWRSNLLKFRRKKGDFVDRLRDIIYLGKGTISIHCYYRYLMGAPILLIFRRFLHQYVGFDLYR